MKVNLRMLDEWFEAPEKDDDFQSGIAVAQIS